MKRNLMVIGGIVAVMATSCSKFVDDSVQQALNEQQNAGAVAPRFSLCVYNAASGAPSGAALYCDRGGSGALSLVAGRSYIFQITQDTDGGPFVFRSNYQRVDLMSSSPSAPVDMVAGNNVFVAPAAGDYAVRIAVVDGATVHPARTFAAGIACNNPTPLSVGGLNMAGVSVSRNTDNVFSFSSAGVVSGSVGGQAPYLCAWDFNGDGTRDSAYADCGTARNNVYVNHHGTRNVGLIVKDSCNTTVSANVARSLMGEPARVPGDGSVFIHGVVSNATGAAASHLGVNNVNYWATNQNAAAGRVVVTPNFEARGANSTFTIGASYSYGQPSSVEFGERLEMVDLNIVLGVDAASTSVDAANARLSRIQFSTDQAGDSQLPLALAGTTCTLTDQGARVVQVVGVPCAAGSENPDWQNMDMRWTLHVWGRYVCTNVSASGASATISGEFDGIDDIVDGCIGGGQGQGGGVTPPRV